MSNAEQKLAMVRGNAPERTPSVRVLNAATAHSDCPFAMLALATRTDLDRLCDNTYFQADFGQDPQAFQRGNMFERRVKDNSYAALIQLLRDKAGFPIPDVRIEDLRGRAAPNQKGLIQRAAETKRLLRMIARNDAGAPNIIDGAVLTCNIAGNTAYFEADSLATSSGRRLHVAEIKSFPITDGRTDPAKLGAACEQAAWYILLCRRTLAAEGFPVEAISSEGFVILPHGVGLTPTLLRHDLTAKIRRADRLLATAPDPRSIVDSLSQGITMPGLDVVPEDRLDQLDRLLDSVGSSYKPTCLQDCGMARMCRSRAHSASATALCGSRIVRQLPGVPTLTRADELAAGATTHADEVHVGTALRRARVVFDRVIARGEL